MICQIRRTRHSLKVPSRFSPIFLLQRKICSCRIRQLSPIKKDHPSTGPTTNAWGCSLRVYIMSEDGKEITLYRIYPGELCILSASCVLSSITFDVYIDAVEDSQVLQVSSSVISLLMHDNIYVEAFANRAAAERFSDVMWAMQQILFMSFDRRLAIFLLDESASLGTDRLPLTHEQIAKLMGSAREVVTRMLKYFSQEGYVALSRGCVTLLDKKALRKLADTQP